MAERKLPVVQTAGLCKTFRDFWRRPRVEAVKDLNLEIKPGEVFGLLGPNGSGKTTTIKMLLGLLYPSRGRISVFGKAPTDVTVKGRIGFLPEESYLYRFLVAHETLDYYGRLFRLPERIRRERIERLLDMVGLRHEAKRPIGEYSKGMARRIGLAQALINDPEFLILDEPTSGLDPIGARQIKDVIKELGRKGKTILLSSHVLADVEDVSDRVVILYGGQQMAAGDIDDLLADQDQTQFTTSALSDRTIERIQNLVEEETERGLLEVTHPRQKLETFFLNIVEEAQRKEVKTSGARAAGALPEFLGKGSSEPADVVSALVAASSERRREPVAAPGVDAGRKEDPSRAVIDQLTQKQPPEEAAAKKSPAPAPGQEQAPVADEDQDKKPRPAVKADKSVIDSLLGGGSGAAEDAEDKP